MGDQLERFLPGGQIVSIQKIQSLLETKNDTCRGVGLALLKSVLDNSSELRGDETTIVALWDSISPRFLDRLLRTGAGSGYNPPVKPMLDLAVSLIHLFVLLLPEQSKKENRLVGRIPQLVPSLLCSSRETTRLILEILLSLASHLEGAAVLTQTDLVPLLAMAPSQPLAMRVFSFAWINTLARRGSGLDEALVGQLDTTIERHLSFLRGSETRPLVECLVSILRSIDTQMLRPNPKWLSAVVALIRNMFKTKPLGNEFTDSAVAAECAPYINLAATLLQIYPLHSPLLLFSAADQAECPEMSSTYRFVTLLTIDLGASVPSQVALLNSPACTETSERLVSAFDIVTSFVGYLMRSVDMELDDETGTTTLLLSPDLLLKLRRSIATTLSVTMQYLRDRWDASVAGALGLHPDARAHPSADIPSRLAVAWDSSTHEVGADALVLASVRCLALWLREDDNPVLRREARGLMDMMLELYRGSAAKESGKGHLDFRHAVLVAFQGILAVRVGGQDLDDEFEDEEEQAESCREFLKYGGWQALETDLLDILQATTALGSADRNQAARGPLIIAVLMAVVRNAGLGIKEDWMDLVTEVAGWTGPEDDVAPLAVLCFQAGVIELVADLLAQSPPGIRRRYSYSKSAVAGIASQLREMAEKAGDDSLVQFLEDDLRTLESL